jgi:hypothetical protein
MAHSENSENPGIAEWAVNFKDVLCNFVLY